MSGDRTMKLTNPARGGLIALVFVYLVSSTLAQVAPNRSDSAKNGRGQKNIQVSSDTVGAPGKMVLDRVAQLQAVTDPPPASITQEEEDGPFDLFMASLVDAFFGALQGIITAFVDLLLERWGFEPIDNGNDNNNNNSNDNDNDNSNTNDNTNDNDNDNENDNVNANDNDNDNTRPSTGVRKQVLPAPTYAPR